MNFFRPFLSDTAYLLVIHGSRDPRPGKAVQDLAQQVSLNLGTGCFIESASLEFAEVPLHQQIVAFGDRALRLGCRFLKVVPLFLLPGIHVRDDIPEEVTLARGILGETLSVDILPYLGSYSGISELLSNRLSSLIGEVESIDMPPVILMAHGSRRSGGNQPIESIASRLGATSAYWSIAPKLLDQIQALAPRGYSRIVVIPYFLFAGGITDAIARDIDVMNRECKAYKITLGMPLGSNADLAALIAQEIEKEPQNLVTSNTLNIK